MARRPALAAVKGANPGLPRMEALAPVNIKVPAARGTMTFSASRAKRKPPNVPTRQARSKKFASISRKLPL